MIQGHCAVGYYSRLHYELGISVHSNKQRRKLPHGNLPV